MSEQALHMRHRFVWPEGVPGMLRSQAAVGDTVELPAKLALRIARRIETLEIERDAAKRVLVDDVAARLVDETRRYRRTVFAGGLVIGLALGLCLAVLA